MTFKKIVLTITICAIILYVMGLLFPMNLEKESMEGKNGFMDLLLHNSKAELLSLIMGTITLGIYSLIYLFINFFTMGIITATLMSDNNSVAEVLRMFIVHGIFEIPAMILTIALGIYIPWKLIGMLRKKSWNRTAMKNMARIFVVIVVLTILAAAVESFITPNFI